MSNIRDGWGETEEDNKYPINQKDDKNRKDWKFRRNNNICAKENYEIKEKEGILIAVDEVANLWNIRFN